MCVASVDVLKRSIFAHRFPCSTSMCLLTTHSGILCHVIAGLSAYPTIFQVVLLATPASQAVHIVRTDSITFFYNLS